MTAVTLTAIITGVGAAIDYNTMVSKKTYLQNIADSAVLAAATSGESELSELQAVADTFIAASNYPDATAHVKLTDEGTIIIDISDPQEMFIMGAFGDKTKKIGAYAEAPLPGEAKLNLALVLDMTESMDGSRLIALKTSAEDLLDELEKNNGDDDGNENNEDNVKVSLIPFADYVRISTDNDGAPWLELQPEATVTWNALDKDNSVNCRQVGSGETAYTECDVYAYHEKSTEIKWVGCMASRPDGFHKVAEFQGRRMQGLAGHSSCGTHYNVLKPLTSDLDDIKSEVEDLKAYGKTYLPAGLVWGWRTLDSKFPFTETKNDKKDDVNNVLLLMTDGSNTTSLRGTKDNFDGIYHWRNSSQADQQTEEANTLTDELCTSIKTEGIQIVTIAFEVTDTTTKNILKACASSGSDFYDATDTSELKAAFSKIGSGLNDVRLIR